MYNKIFILFILKVMICNNIFLLLPYNYLANNFLKKFFMFFNYDKKYNIILKSFRKQHISATKNYEK